MATPIKSLKCLLSPQLRTSINASAKRLPDYRITNVNTRNIPKRLDFAEVSEPQQCSPDSKVKIYVSECASNATTSKFERKSSLIVNTPNKLQVQSYGLTAACKDLNVLGRGTFGTVVQGKYEDKDVAVKIIRNNKPIRECNILSLSHPNIVRVIDIIENSSLNYSMVILELAENSTQLGQLIDNDFVPCDWFFLRKLCVDIATGLQYCHARGILHLDIKPSNVLVCKGGVAKLCDFGNSYLVDSQDKFKHYGTVIYTAPEILTGRLPTFLSDVYSLGILFWQMQHRKTPYGDLNNTQIVIYKVVKFDLRPSIDLTFIGDAFTELYQSCWSTCPSNRPQLTHVIDTILSSKYGF